MEATSEQRQRLLEAIYRRNSTRRRTGLPPLNLTMAYAHGLNRILRTNVASSRQYVQNTNDQNAPQLTGVVLSFRNHAGTNAVLLDKRNS